MGDLEKMPLKNSLITFEFFDVWVFFFLIETESANAQDGPIRARIRAEVWECLPGRTHGVRWEGRPVVYVIDKYLCHWVGRP